MSNLNSGFLPVFTEAGQVKGCRFRRDCPPDEVLANAELVLGRFLHEATLLPPEKDGDAESWFLS